MGDMHPNAQVVMKGFQAFGEGDMAALKELFAEDAVWHTGGRNKFSGDHVGIDSIFQVFADIRAEATIDNQPHAILADDEHVVALITANLSRGDDALTASNVFVFHVNDGKVSEVWTSSFDQYAVDAFWG